jgi:branched-chain amino acid transport system permease protein
MGYGLYLTAFGLTLLMYVFGVQIIARTSQAWPFCMPAIGGVAAYTTAVLSTRYGWNPALSLVLGVCAASFVGAVTGLVLGRMNPDHASIASLSLQVGWIALFVNWSSITRGALGITGIPPLVENSTPDQRALISIAILGLGALAWLTARRLASGTILESLETAHFECQDYLSSAGWPVADFQAAAWVVASALAGFSGCVWAQFISFIDPSTFGASDALLVVCIALLSGPAAGVATVVTIAFVAFPEILRWFGVSSQVGAAVQQVAFGVFLVCVVGIAVNRRSVYDSQ